MNPHRPRPNRKTRPSHDDLALDWGSIPACQPVRSDFQNRRKHATELDQADRYDQELDAAQTA